MSNRCPKCTSENVYYSKKKGIWICEECELEFAENNRFQSVSTHMNLTTRIFLNFGRLHSQR